MDGLDTTSKRRTIDLPNKPETGLAEWTNRIKALQRQVDEDEETEHKRLEEEIKASRLARLRRSTGGGSKGNVADFPSAEVVALKEASATHLENGRTKQQHQDDALERLIGPSSSQRTDSSSSAPTKAPNISLAAFMGSRATGPRLTRPLPQQDAQDPTQFEQRARAGEPHPIFGRGGVALPGMAGSNKVTGSQVPAVPDSPVSGGPSNPRRDRNMSTPSIVKSFVFKVEGSQLATERSSGRETATTNGGVRHRTQSTPSGPHSRQTHSSSSAQPQCDNSPLEQQNGNSLPVTTPINTPPRIVTPSTPRPLTLPHSSQQMSTSPVRSHTTTPLSRPVQPEPRPLTTGPQTPSPSTSSPAFLRAPLSKDPTPSISRLQGRGFVQSVVKANSQLTAAATGNSPLVPRSASGLESGRKATVLDRWQFESGGQGASPTPPIISPKPIPVRKSRTFDPSSPLSPSTPSTPPPSSPLKSIRPRPSLPTVSQPELRGSRPSSRNEVPERVSPPRQVPSAGSSTTLLSYVKPLKTGDNQYGCTSLSPTPIETRRAAPVADELGVRVRPEVKGTSARMSGEVEQATGDPSPGSENGGVGKGLNHPTRDRARKPRKARDTTKEAVAKYHKHEAILGANGGHALQPPSSSQANPLEPSLAVLASIPPIQAQQPISHSRSSSVSLPQGHQHTTDTAKPDHFIAEFSRTSTALSHVPKPESQPPIVHSVAQPTGSTSAQVPEKLPQASSPKPKKHYRIPSTGRRATVMDVAMALSEHEKHVRELSGDKPREIAASSFPPSIEQSEVPERVTSLASHPSEPSASHLASDTDSQDYDGTPASSTRGGQQRKGSHERYSVFTLPPLVEERTPVSSPFGTLNQAPIPQAPEQCDAPSLQVGLEPSLPTPRPGSPDVTSVGEEASGVLLPSVDIHPALSPVTPYRVDPDIQTISVDVMSIVGTSATPITREFSIFYDSELLIIVHRFKTKSSGLVSMTLWSWYGKKNNPGEREERKLQELARHYNTSLIRVKQYSEPSALVAVLGGQLITRQGSRSRWSKENTTMHIVRCVHDSVFIDEIELGAKNLCSGFAYCLSLLGTLYVWFGLGSTSLEQKAALSYAQSLAVAGTNAIELRESASDDDEMFWMMLGEREYAQADYWRWRPSTRMPNPRIWKIQDHSGGLRLSPMTSILNEPVLNNHVYIFDCGFEYYVVVGEAARGLRREIGVALSAALELSSHTKASKPFIPPVHVLIFPSQIPCDLRLTFRDLEDLDSGQAPYPDHMNLIPVDDAYTQLQRTSWDRAHLKDTTMLPLGVQPDDI